MNLSYFKAAPTSGGQSEAQSQALQGKCWKPSVQQAQPSKSGTLGVQFVTLLG